MYGCELLSLYSTRWPVGFDVDWPWEPFGPVNCRRLTAIHLVPRVAKGIVDGDPAFSGTHSDARHLILTYKFILFAVAFGVKIAVLHDSQNCVCHQHCCFSSERKLCSSLLLLSAFIAVTLLYNHKISFRAAVMKRPASKLTKAVQQVNKKQSKESDLHLGARWNNLNLTAAVIKHLRVIGKDTNGFDIWAEEKDKFDIYICNVTDSY